MIIEVQCSTAYKYPSVGRFTVDGRLGASQFAPLNIPVHMPGEYRCPFLLETCLDMELSGHSLSTWTTLGVRAKLFPNVFAVIHTPISKVPTCPTSFPALRIVSLIHFSHFSLC